MKRVFNEAQKQARREANRRYRARNPNRGAEYAARMYAADPEKFQARCRCWQEKNKHLLPQKRRARLKAQHAAANKMLAQKRGAQLKVQRDAAREILAQKRAEIKAKLAMPPQSAYQRRVQASQFI